MIRDIATSQLTAIDPADGVYRSGRYTSDVRGRISAGSGGRAAARRSDQERSGDEILHAASWSDEPDVKASRIRRVARQCNSLAAANVPAWIAARPPIESASNDGAACGYARNARRHGVTRRTS
jgi:hypothetical protein